MNESDDEKWGIIKKKAGALGKSMFETLQTTSANIFNNGFADTGKCEQQGSLKRCDNDYKNDYKRGQHDAFKKCVETIVFYINSIYSGKFMEDRKVAEQLLSAIEGLMKENQ